MVAPNSETGRVSAIPLSTLVSAQPACLADENHAPERTPRGDKATTRLQPFFFPYGLLVRNRVGFGRRTHSMMFALGSRGYRGGRSKSQTLRPREHAPHGGEPTNHFGPSRSEPQLKKEGGGKKTTGGSPHSQPLSLPAKVRATIPHTHTHTGTAPRGTHVRLLSTFDSLARGGSRFYIERGLNEAAGRHMQEHGNGQMSMSVMALRLAGEGRRPCMYICKTFRWPSPTRSR